MRVLLAKQHPFEKLKSALDKSGCLVAFAVCLAKCLRAVLYYSRLQVAVADVDPLRFGTKANSSNALLTCLLNRLCYCVEWCVFVGTDIQR